MILKKHTEYFHCNITDKWKDQSRHKELLQKQDLNKDEKSELEKLSVEYQVRNLKFENIKEAYNTLDRDHYEKLRDEFFNAASGSDLEKSKKLLQENVDISTPFLMRDKLVILWHFAVLKAISDSKWERFLKKDIITKLTPTDINAVSDISNNAFYIACSRKNIYTARMFIDHGAKFGGGRNNNEIDTVMKLLPYIIDGRKDVLDINIRFSDPGSWHEADTVLSYAAANNLRDDKGTLIVQQLFDHYKSDISPETVYSALTATNDNSLDSAKIILQNSHGLQKDHFNSMLDTRFNAEQYENYSLILSHVAKQGYNDVINQQHSQIIKELNDCQSLGDDQGIKKCNRFLEIHRTISSPKHSQKEKLVAERVKLFESKDTQEQNFERKVISEIKKGLVENKMKLFENTGQQEQKSEYKGISKIKKGLVEERTATFSAKNSQKNDQKSDIREQPSTRVKDIVNKLEEKSSNQEKSKKVDKALSHVNVSELKRRFEERYYKH
ncbi:MAG: hypothetical protein PG981_001119 [Wolbachia endosymbiont of Ctenocephalides orientis wCori]|nr:MAG: hypothetical protein PG981_001119 [Wolbachia endosymbiont of Ctenocephalides orientis wCori]